MSRWRNLVLRSRGMQIDGYAWLRQIEVPRDHHRISLAKNVMLDRGVTLICSEGESSPGTALIEIGENVYINRNTILDASEGIRVGDQCMIGPACYITDHDHHVELGKAPADGPLHGEPVSIGARAWLGAGAIVLKGVSIGEGSVIGAGAVVTKDVPANCIAVGNPAKVVREI